jgi:hypothetical protein
MAEEKVVVAMVGAGRGAADVIARASSAGPVPAQWTGWSTFGRMPLRLCIGKLADLYGGEVAAFVRPPEHVG